MMTTQNPVVPPVKSNNVFFCQTLQDAFAQAGMPYLKQSPRPGQIVRFSTNGDSSDTSGWCRLFPDGIGAVFGCHRAGSKFTWQQRDESCPPPSIEERQAAIAKSELVRKEAEIERAEEYASAAEMAKKIFAASGELNSAHEYVTKKGITPYAGRLSNRGDLTLSVYGSDGALQSLQFIDADGDKRFLPKGKMSGGRLYLGQPENGLPLILCEGWATGCSIHEATDETVVVGFSGGNLDDVAMDLRRQYPDSPLLIAGDLDAHGNGLEYAQAATIAGSPATIIIPSFIDGRDAGDFNDLHQAEGLDAVFRQLDIDLNLPDSLDPKIVEALIDFPVAPFVNPTLQKCDVRDGTIDTRPLTEIGNSQRIFDVHGDRLRYIFDANNWILWTGKAWQWDSQGSFVRTIASRLPSKIYEEAAGHIGEAEHFVKWARTSSSEKIIRSTVSLLKDFQQVRLPHSLLDADHYAIGFDNASQVIDLKSGMMRSAAPEDYITKSLNVGSIGNADHATRWRSFLEQIFDDDLQMIDWIQRFCGYLLTGSIEEHFFLFCSGYGANGKSVFIETLKFVMGDYSRTVAPETLTDTKRRAGAACPDLVALVGARMALCSETESDSPLAESLVKRLTGGDSSSVRQLYGSQDEFKPIFKLIIAGNHKPDIKGTDDGIWRRVRIAPFTKKFEGEKRDTKLGAKLQTEAPHILAWMVQGCLEWQRRGLTDIPDAMRAATDAYRLDQDDIGRWLSECTTKSTDEVSASDLYANYMTWANENDIFPESAKKVGNSLTERGYGKRSSNGKTYRRGLKIKDLRQGKKENQSALSDSWEFSNMH